MWDYLEYVEPDYSDEYLELSPNFAIPAPGGYRQSRNETDGGNPKVVTMKDTPDVHLTLKFTGVETANYNILADLYYNPAKAYGMAKSYVWKHPQTDELFTVQNTSQFSETLMTYNRYDISFSLKVLGIAVDSSEFGVTHTDTPDITYTDTPEITYEDRL